MEVPHIHFSLHDDRCATRNNVSLFNDFLMPAVGDVVWLGRKILRSLNFQTSMQVEISIFLKISDDIALSRWSILMTRVICPSALIQCTTNLKQR